MSGAKLLDYWSPPEGAGAPVACFATTFTFEADFFAQDCLSRFLSLSTVIDEGGAISSIAAVLEEEDRLSEAQVSVLVDRSSPAEKRNLRWDVLPVAVPRGLLHAKVAALLWERSTRIILGSANLTSAGYRRQVELALAIDLHEGCGVPRSVLDEIVAEFGNLAKLSSGPRTGPKERVLATIELLAARVDALELPESAGRELRLAVAPARPGVSPLDRLADVWRGAQPRRATVLSPFWDDHVPSPALEAIRTRLTGRSSGPQVVRVVTAIDPITGVVQAPPSLASQPDTEVVVFEPPDAERRNLHAKLFLVESDQWLAALIGSSNATSAGLGLDRGSGHHELNLWLGCPATSATARHLRGLARMGHPIDIGDERWEPVPDEDEPTVPVLPLGFISCTIDAQTPIRALLELDVGALPEVWDVRTPAGQVILTAEDWGNAGSPSSLPARLPDQVLPAYLFVRWDEAGESRQATWTANVEDRSTLPPPAELAALPVAVVLAALASTRPLPVALEQELRRRERINAGNGQTELDPLRRFDASGLLLQRTRHISLALWRLQERLSRPASTLDAVHWRLNGALGPLAIAEGLVTAAHEQQTLPGEAAFLLAELALTVAAVDWDHLPGGVGVKDVERLVSELLTAIVKRREDLPPVTDVALDAYVRDALEEAQR